MENKDVMEREEAYKFQMALLKLVTTGHKVEFMPIDETESLDIYIDGEYATTDWGEFAEKYI